MPIALFSVWDKSGSLDLARRLTDAGWQLVASGGTAQVLLEARLPVTPIAEITGEPSMLSGRVKTLHPLIFAGLLARDTIADREELRARGWPLIDLLVANLYPFEEVVARPESRLEDAIENIDIGGVALLRAAAKNYARVCVLSDPADYPHDLRLIAREDYRLRMACKAFAYVVRYDASIQAYFSGLNGTPQPFTLHLYPVQELRYGENPHQGAAFYGPSPASTPLSGELLGGKELSYNNLLDLDTAWRAALVFDEPAVVVVKHASPCGIAAAPWPERALELAIRSDPVSAFGGVIACNRPVGRSFVTSLKDLFVECIAAPGFDAEARRLLASKKNLRLVLIPSTSRMETYELRSVLGGYLRQAADLGDPPDSPPWQAVTRRAPSEAELRALGFAWKACRYVKSNAIVLAGGDGTALYTVGIGGGQPNRLDSVRLAGERAGERAPNSVLASDGFFPFPDGIELAASLGVTAIAQPGGSRRDRQVIEAADEAGLAMAFTGIRHFRH